MRIFKIILICCLVSIIPPAFAEKGTFVDEIRFIQYLDENTALEEVRNGNLDMYYYRISSDRLEDSDSKQGLNVYESTGGYYSILLNPTDEGRFNPFSIQEIRYSINYLVDRDLIVNELLGGFGTSMYANYGSFSAEYLRILKHSNSNTIHHLLKKQFLMSWLLGEQRKMMICGIMKMNQ